MFLEMEEIFIIMSCWYVSKLTITIATTNTIIFFAPHYLLELIAWLGIAITSEHFNVYLIVAMMTGCFKWSKHVPKQMESNQIQRRMADKSLKLDPLYVLIGNNLPKQEEQTAIGRKEESVLAATTATIMSMTTPMTNEANMRVAKTRKSTLDDDSCCCCCSNLQT